MVSSIAAQALLIVRGRSSREYRFDSDQNQEAERQVLQEIFGEEGGQFEQQQVFE